MGLRNRLAFVSAGDGSGPDNLAIALCSYFSDHVERPDDDQEGDDGWGEWVVDQTNKTLDALAAEARSALT